MLHEAFWDLRITLSVFPLFVGGPGENGPILDFRWENRTDCKDAGLEMPCIPVLEVFWVIITQSGSHLLRSLALPLVMSPVTLVKGPILY